jgi:hypothetical protein
VPVLSKGRERAQAIMSNQPGAFVVAENPKAKPYANPVYSRTAKQEVTANEALIDAAAARYGMDPDLPKAPAWMESTHGWYDWWTGHDLGVTRESLLNARTNIETGVFILAEIRRRTIDATPEKIYTLYNTSTRTRSRTTARPRRSTTRRSRG